MPRAEVPAVEGILTAGQVRRTGAAIASAQLPDGAIPWFAGEHLDPWDHVEAAMALTAAGFPDAARRAFAWSAGTQRADGSWPMRTVAGRVTAAEADTNQCAYIAVGVWHHVVVTGDVDFAARLWPTVFAAVEFVLSCAGADGDIAWAVGRDGQPATESLLAGNSSIFQALRCAIALAELTGHAEPEWELAAGRLGHLLAAHRDLFADKSRFAMDWYYPVLGGAVHGAAARLELDARWDDFVMPGWGSRCVADRPWVTGAETCELVIALDACGASGPALDLFADIQHLRHDDGSYWTGYVVPDEAIWPAERCTWTAAAVVLAADALSGATPAAGLFRGQTLGQRPVWTGGSCGCTTSALR